MFLLILRIAWNFHQLHTVKKRSRDSLYVIGRCNKQYFGKILRDLHIVIVELTVLLRIKDFQKCRRSVSLIVTAGLVDLVKKHQRIADSGFFQCNRDPSGHGADVGLSVSTDLRFITDTAETDADVFFVHGLRHRTGNGSFSGSGRSHQAEDRALSLVGQFPDRKKFHDTLFNIFQSVVAFFQYFPCILKILGILRFLIPRKCKNSLQIASLYRCLRCTGCHSFKTADLLGNLLFYFIGCIQLFQLFLKLLDIICSIILTQFFTDSFELFTEDILSLILINMGFHLALEIFGDMDHFDLAAKKRSKDLITVIQRHCFQKLLLVLIGHRKVHRNLVDGLLNILNGHDLCYQIFAYLSALSAISLEKFPDAAKHGIFHRFRILLFLGGNDLTFRFQVGFFLLQAQYFSSVQSFYQNPVKILRKFHHLLDVCNGSYPIQIIKFRCFHFRVLLCQQKDLLVMEHGCFHGTDGFLSAHIKVYDHLRKDRSPT